MKLILDIECNALEPSEVTHIWCAVCKDVDTGEVYEFTEDQIQSGDLWKLLDCATSIIGHNITHYDYCVLDRLFHGKVNPLLILDTLVLSRLLKYKLDDGQGHGLEAWGTRLGLPKHPSPDFQMYTPEMLEYCKQDVEINYKLYEYLKQHMHGSQWAQAIDTEMQMAWICLDMHQNGFKYDKAKADELGAELRRRLHDLDSDISKSFPPKVVPIREITPKLTKHGTISKANLPRDWTDLTKLHANCPFTLVELESFNPGSTSQVVDRLNKAGWKPTVPTGTGKSFKLNEENLATLPETAPEGAKKLLERIIVANRIRTLKEWNEHCQIHLKLEKGDTIENIVNTISRSNANGEKHTQHTQATTITNIKKNIDEERKIDRTKDTTEYQSKKLSDLLLSKITNVKSAQEKLNCTSTITMTAEELEDFSVADVISTMNGSCSIHGRFNSIGTWTGRMSHTRPNAGNIATRKSIKYKTPALKELALDLGGTMRSFWICDSDSWLIGCDMEAAHVRLFAHYIDDKEFTKAVCSGDKKNGTDVHTLGANVFKHLGCDRDNHKTFIFSFFNGAGPPKVADIFGCSLGEARRALQLYQERYPGLRKLKQETIPAYAKQGWFPGLDKRRVYCNDEHLMFAGMLQSGESIVMKMANILWRRELRDRGIKFRQVNLVHDEFVTESCGDRDLAGVVGDLQAKAIADVGRALGLRCPLAGEYKVGKTWLEVH